VDALGGFREKDRRLSGRIRAPHHGHLFAAAELPLEVGRGIVNAGPFETSERREIELPITRPRGDDDGARSQLLPIGQDEAIWATVAIEPYHGAADRDFGAELFGLGERPPRQCLTGDAGRKTEVVLDARARAR